MITCVPTGPLVGLKLEMTAGELHIQVARALTEIREHTEFFREYEDFLDRLEALQRSLATGEFDDSLLEETQRVIPGKLRPHRGGIPADDSLKETRLLVNELNHIIKSRRQKLA